jgi:DNA-binding HxlR family transcriptional regulator
MPRLNHPNQPHVPDVLTATCPSRRVLELITNKWSVLVVHALFAGPVRFATLHRRIQGVSQKVLTQTLRRMQRDGLVSRRILAGKPPGAEYQLTQSAMDLGEPINALCAWAEQHGVPEHEAQTT